MTRKIGLKRTGKNLYKKTPKMELPRYRTSKWAATMGRLRRSPEKQENIRLARACRKQNRSN